MALVVLFAGCYGGKLVKMPINADIASQRLDTLQTRQEEILRILDTLSVELRKQREERLRGQAAGDARLTEMEESIRILFNKLDDSMQLMQSLRGSKPVVRKPVRRAAKDTLARAIPDSLRGSSPAPADEEEKLFKSSYMDLTLGNFDMALQGFKNYLVRYPGGAHLPEVHYYLAECQYALEKFVEAVGEYQFVIRKYPKSRLVPAAYLKAGFCYTKLDELNLAEKSFRELISRFPHSEEAEHARAALKDLGG